MKDWESDQGARLHVGGLKDEQNLSWLSRVLAPGDEIVIRVVEEGTPTPVQREPSPSQ